MTSKGEPHSRGRSWASKVRMNAADKQRISSETMFTPLRSSYLQRAGIWKAKKAPVPEEVDFLKLFMFWSLVGGMAEEWRAVGRWPSWVSFKMKIICQIWHSVAISIPSRIQAWEEKATSPSYLRVCPNCSPIVHCFSVIGTGDRVEGIEANCGELNNLVKRVGMVLLFLERGVG